MPDETLPELPEEIREALLLARSACLGDSPREDQQADAARRYLIG